MGIALKKYKKGKWRYELLEDFKIDLEQYKSVLPFIPFEHEYCEHKYFILQKPWGKEFQVHIKKGYRWDGATGLPDLFQTTELQIPSLVHDVFCQATDEGLLKYEPWREYGDYVFKALYKNQYKDSYEPYKLRMNVLFKAVRTWSTLKGFFK